MKSKAYNMDCMAFMKKCNDKQFDLAIVDPPYGIEEITGKEVNHGRGKLKHRAFNSGEKKFNEWDKKPPKEYFAELFRVSKNQVIFGGNYFDLPPVRGFIIWDKCQPFPNFSACEFAWTSFNVPAKIFKFDNRTAGKIHPTQKPETAYSIRIWEAAHRVLPPMRWVLILPARRLIRNILRRRKNALKNIASSSIYLSLSMDKLKALLSHNNWSKYRNSRGSK